MTGGRAEEIGGRAEGEEGGGGGRGDGVGEHYHGLVHYFASLSSAVIINCDHQLSPSAVTINE